MNQVPPPSLSIFRKRWRKFRSLKRGYYSFLIIVTAYLVSFVLPLLVNSKPLLVRYEGEYFFPMLRFHGPGPEGNGSAASDQVAAAFRREFYDTELFFDPYARGKFGAYLLKAQGRSAADYDSETAHQLIEEAYLFIEASHACYARLAELQAATA